MYREKDNLNSQMDCNLVSPDKLLLNHCDDFKVEQEQIESSPEVPPHWTVEQQQELNQVIIKFEALFSSKTGLTNLEHNIF